MPYTFCKSGVFYFQRMVPQDLVHHYRTARISFSLRTRSRVEAQRRAYELAGKLEQQWLSLRGSHIDVLDGFLKRSVVPGFAPLSELTHDTGPEGSAGTLSEAVELYLKLKGAGKAATFSSAANRAAGYLIQIAGDKPLGRYTRSDATTLRDKLFERGMAGSSVSRTFTTIKAVFNFACAEWGADLRNPFVGVYFDRMKGVARREPFSSADVQAIQRACREADDDLRWIVGLVSDTGARLAEVVGLAREDIELGHPSGPVLRIREHPWRSLKTRSSAGLLR